MRLTPARAAIAIVFAVSLSISQARAQDSLSKVKPPRSTGPTELEVARHWADQSMKHWLASWNARDTTALFRMLNDDVSLFPDSVRVGRAAVEQWMRESVAHSSGLRITPLYTGGNGRTAYQTGRWKLATSPGAKTGVYTFVFTASNADWKLRSMYILGDPGPSR
jgi:ketosteroid isomerase-like protein